MAARRYWFVLVLFGVLLALSLPLYRLPGTRCGRAADGICAVPIRATGGILGPEALDRPGWLAAYWAVALLLALWLTARRYRRAGRLRRALPALFVMVLLGGAATALTLTHWHGFRSPSAVLGSAQLLIFNGATPLLVSAAALILLAAAERSSWLLLFAFGYAALAYALATYDAFHLLELVRLPVDESADRWGVRQCLALAVPAGLLLVAGVVAAVAGRSPRQVGRHARGAVPAVARRG
ncbi:lysylphosphatidylglycerol synthetase-like protein (DUF2156 family) [Kitasatospora gansuensis]|uniref:Lysylphosphatidylglycerol synthetase-like protein (DUF2156 family) n=1 Tax=Kitasatospora gansuensis TaxID=258050 RepID=A0A7W7SJ83_9ACTN|nr:hypothetical protein [Kitasatospora gansuensis]MBB4951455.1 lysylphosphatidylglycerol synthetase-like protein (DUF2156 family) [Kitasatospora gansuensis]